MRIPSFSKGGEVGFNMTPMIDVVFQLIIFFLVSSHLAKQEVQLTLPLPEAKSGIAEKPSEKPRLTVNVLADGTLLLAGRQVTADELRARLVERQKDLGKDVEVRIRGDRSTAYKHVEPVMLACARSGIWNVSYAVYEKEPR
ncbi:MAG: biopolymer transporter ExbD [Planctomycetales bacterium]|nr:biopolymer transporter ExbD [Planctomycetales bacterium]